MKRLLNFLAAVFIGIYFLTATVATAQTTEFVFNGDLNDPAETGIFDMQFRVFDAATAGSQEGAVITVPAVSVTDGKFSVNLDFGSAPFSVAEERWIEIRKSPPGAGSYTTITPRTKVLSVPFATRAIYATSSNQLAGVDAAEFVQTTDSRLSDARQPLPGSSSYIQNSAAYQPAANFNISGNGSVGGSLSAFGSVNSSTQFNLAGSRILVGNDTNLFTGRGAGFANTTGADNTFIGAYAGGANTTGVRNSYLGSSAGYSGTTATNNSFFGYFAGTGTTASFNSFFGAYSGAANSTGSHNSFFGNEAGRANGNGSNNTFFGSTAGRMTSTGNQNSFFGKSAGYGTGSGSYNAFFGWSAGDANTTGSNNTVIGSSADVGAGNLSYATAIGSGAIVNSSNTLVLGRPSDHVEIGGLLRVSLGAAGSNHVCRNSNFELSTCSSSQRYKSNIAPYIGGLYVINRLRPVSFNWKQDGSVDFGLVAEDVFKVEPLLSSFNSNGEIEGVKYDRVGVVLINAIKEQQAQIQAQQKEIEGLRSTIEVLKKVICSKSPRAAPCR